jgi:hypothetical protein
MASEAQQADAAAQQLYAALGDYNDDRLEIEDVKQAAYNAGQVLDSSRCSSMQQLVESK